MIRGGGGGIRTRDTVSRIHTFLACAFSRSATPPSRAPSRNAGEGDSTARHKGASVTHRTRLTAVCTGRVKPGRGQSGSTVSGSPRSWRLSPRSRGAGARTMLKSVDSGFGGMQGPASDFDRQIPTEKRCRSMRVLTSSRRGAGSRRNCGIRPCSVARGCRRLRDRSARAFRRAGAVACLKPARRSRLLDHRRRRSAPPLPRCAGGHRRDAPAQLSERAAR